VWVKSQKNLNCPDKAKRGQNRGGTKNEWKDNEADGQN
jgi:hypothetical protein